MINVKERISAQTDKLIPEGSRRKRIWERLKVAHHRIQAIRLHNQKRNPKFNALLTLIFPIFIVCLAELNQYVHISSFLEFCISRPKVLLFDFLIAYLLYGLLLFLCNRVWVATWIQGIAYMTVSVVELFKYSTNGNHFKLTDLTLAPNVKNLSSFAYIKITFPLVMYVCILVLVLLLIYIQNPAYSRPWKKRIIPLAGCLATVVMVVCVPTISSTVYGIFDIDTSESVNAFSINEKFRHNSMLAFLVETTSEKLENILDEPEPYDADTITQTLDVPEIVGTAEQKPNVLVVMSESFADFRRLEDLNLKTDAYDAFDAVAEQSIQLDVAVPTYASYTVRTEFELMFGLPVRSLLDAITPQKELTVEYPDSLISYYKELGYQTAYVHPFTQTFYGRDEIYARYGFDQMLFEEDFTVSGTLYPNEYMSDDQVMRQLLQLVQESSEPIYIHTTTMQNHQPYDWIEGASELDVYLEGIRATGDALTMLIAELERIGEPTIVLFVGDHFPSMRAENNLYDRLGINSENCSVLYEQPALIWSNITLDTSVLPEESISTFYLGPMILKMAGLPVNSFYATVLEEMEACPIYTSIFLEEDNRNATLDLLTYDRVLGENYSGTRPQPESEP